jgi:DNA-binding IscR family transcriptional regulator
VADVLESLEGPLALVDGLVERPERRAGAGPGLAIRELWWEATQAALKILRATTIKDLAEREAIQAYSYQI